MMFAMKDLIALQDSLKKKFEGKLDSLIAYTAFTRILSDGFRDECIELTKEVTQLHRNTDQLTSQVSRINTLNNTLRKENARHLAIQRRVEGDDGRICQMLGKALGTYPWYRDDQKNFPNATEIDGVCVGEHVATTIVAEAAKEIKNLKAQLASAKMQEQQ